MLNKENNKNKLIKDLTEENEQLRNAVLYLQTQLEGYKAMDEGGDAWKSPFEFQAILEDTKNLKVAYEQALEEIALLKKKIETEYKEELKQTMKDLIE